MSIAGSGGLGPAFVESCQIDLDLSGLSPRVWLIRILLDPVDLLCSALLRLTICEADAPSTERVLEAVRHYIHYKFYYHYYI